MLFFLHVGVNGVSRQGYRWFTNQAAPRLGFAYQATSKLVLRGGYAHMYGSSFGGAAVADVPYGFGSETPWVTSLDGITPLNLLRNPYPSGLNNPEGSSRGLLAAVGQGGAAQQVDAQAQVGVAQHSREHIRDQRHLHLLGQLGVQGGIAGPACHRRHCL